MNTLIWLIVMVVMLVMCMAVATWKIFVLPRRAELYRRARLQQQRNRDQQRAQLIVICHADLRRAGYDGLKPTLDEEGWEEVTHSHTQH